MLLQCDASHHINMYCACSIKHISQGPTVRAEIFRSDIEPLISHGDMFLRIE